MLSVAAETSILRDLDRFYLKRNYKGRQTAIVENKDHGKSLKD